MASGTIKSVVPRSDIVNNLTTNDSTKVLSAAQGYALNNKIANKVHTVIISSDVNISLSSLFTPSSSGGTRDFIMFTCVNKLASDMPQNANKYGSGFIINSGYYSILAFYYANDRKLYIGNKGANDQSWTWYSVPLTVVS